MNSFFFLEVLFVTQSTPDKQGHKGKQRTVLLLSMSVTEGETDGNCEIPPQHMPLTSQDY